MQDSERSLWEKARKKLPVLCKLYTKHELSIERLVSLYLHVGLLKAHRTLKEYCTRKLASIDRDSETVEVTADDEATSTKTSKFWKVLNWVNKKLQNWSADKTDESTEPTNLEKNILIYPEKLNLVIFPPSVDSAQEALDQQEDVEEETLSPEELSQDLWEETSPMPVKRSQRMIKEEIKTEKPTFGQFLKSKFHMDAIFAETTTLPPKLKKKEEKSKFVPFVPMPDVLKQEFEKFERQHNLTAFQPIVERKIEIEPRETTNSSATISTLPMTILYLVPVLLIILVLFMVCYLIAFVRRQDWNKNDGSLDRLLDVRIEQGSDVEDMDLPAPQVANLYPMGEKKSRKQSYEDDFLKKIVPKSPLR